MSHDSGHGESLRPHATRYQKPSQPAGTRAMQHKTQSRKTMNRRSTGPANEATPATANPKSNQHVLTVGEVANRSGVAVSAIRFYEAQGLIHSTRTAGNQRRYLRGVLRRVSVIRIAQRAGLSLSEIKTHIDTLPDENVTIAHWRKLSLGWRELINQRITGLTQLRDRLGDCIGCGCLSLKNCPLRNPGDVLSQRGSGPRLLIDE